MKIIKPSFVIINDGKQELDPLKTIELVGRTCYKSEDRINETSAEKFVNMLVSRKHTAMVEHFHFIFRVSEDTYFRLLKARDANGNNDLHFTNCKGRYLVSGNARAINSLGDSQLISALKSLCSPLAYAPCQDNFNGIVKYYPTVLDIPSPSDEEFLQHCYVTVKFIVDRGVSHELVRHRKASWAQESTRYCNYSADKFGQEVTFIKPSFFEDETSKRYVLWADEMSRVERTYLDMLNEGCTPQEARSVLPNSLKTEVMMTANLALYKAFMYLRTPKDAHPQIREVSIRLNNDFFVEEYARLFELVEEM